MTLEEQQQCDALLKEAWNAMEKATDFLHPVVADDQRLIMLLGRLYFLRSAIMTSRTDLSIILGRR